MPDTGAPWFIPYVENTDLVSDWPTDSLALANAIVAALEDIPVTQKKIAAFTSSGTWTVSAGVTYAIAHMMGGGGGNGQTGSGSQGGTSSVAFAGGTVSAPGMAPGGNRHLNSYVSGVKAGVDNIGQGAVHTSDGNGGDSNSVPAPLGVFLTAGDDVTPAASITVTVGAGGAAGTGGAAGGKGYVYIEYYEEV